MTTPTYFSNLPNLKYSVSINKAGKTNDILIKDYFRLLRIREDVRRTDTLYVDYYIKDGQRPDQISYELYGDEKFYWVILQVNDIIDYNAQWPLSYIALDNYINTKYGGRAGAEQIHNYETTEAYNEEGVLMLPGGMIVDKDFTYEYQYNDNVSKVSLPVAVTNHEFETRLNDKKSLIQVIEQKYIWDIDRDTRNYYRTLPDQKSDVDISNALRRSGAH